MDVKAHREYVKPVSFLVGIDLEGALLDGSVTGMPMKVNEVTVENYSDGFATKGGFESLTFE